MLLSRISVILLLDIVILYFNRIMVILSQSEASAPQNYPLPPTSFIEFNPFGILFMKAIQMDTLFLIIQTPENFYSQPSYPKSSFVLHPHSNSKKPSS